jgi:beta-lactamase regulating signal transducer with metallopeptidase domain
MMQIGIKATAELLALRSVDSLIEGTAVCALAWLMLRIVPRQNAASRFAVWFSALMAIALGPSVGAMWPSAQIIGRSTQQAIFAVPESWALYFVAAWFAVSIWMLIGLVHSLVHLRNLRTSCVAIDSAVLDPLVRETLRRHSSARSVSLCTSNRVKVPAAIGFWNPTIVVPEWAVSELSADELNQIVLHELAHLRRLDDWTNLAQQIIKALFFFHPAVWWIEKKASLEREIACDDAVLAETARPQAYAECLARLAEKSLVHRSLSMAQAALGKVRQMSIRVAQILDTGRPEATGAVWLPAASLVVVFAVGCSMWNLRSPRLIAFEDGAIPAAPAAMVASAAAPEVRQGPAVAKLTPVRLTEKQVSPRVLATQPKTSARAKASLSTANSMVQLVGAKPSNVPVTETMWIVVERDESHADYQVVQIQMWHVTILHGPAAASTPQIPRKI